MSTYNNETIGISAEKFLCDIYNVECTIEPHRYNNEFIERLYYSNTLEVLENNNISIVEHIGTDNGPTDFNVYTEEHGEATLSLKTLKKPEGRIAPQGGQPTYNSFDRRRNLTDKTANLGRVEANTIRFEWLKDNIGDFLNEMQAQTFCCNYTLLISNCDNNPHSRLIRNRNYNFNNMNITYSRSTYEELPHPRRPPPATSEFSCTVYGVINGETKSIGEIQFHKSSRQQVKFRFNSTLFH